MSNKQGQAAEIKLENFLEKLDGLYKEFDITCTEVYGVARMMHTYDGDKRIYVEAAQGVLCLKCGFIYQRYPDNKCPQCLEKINK